MQDWEIGEIKPDKTANTWRSTFNGASIQKLKDHGVSFLAHTLRAVVQTFGRVTHVVLRVSNTFTREFLPEPLP